MTNIKKSVLSWKISLCLLVSFVILSSCIDENPDKFSTFEDDTIASFLENHPEDFSDFIDLLEASSVYGLMAAYGHYTCFAPTNKAIQAYYAEENTSFAQLTDEDIRDLVFNHILPIKLKSIDFPDGMVFTANLQENFLNITYQTVGNASAIFVNDRSRIILLDNEVHNGIIHTVDNVIRTAKIFLPEIIAEDPRYSIFSKALYETKLADSLRIIDDKDYVTGSEKSRKRGETNLMPYPELLKRGVTAFVESDSVFAANDILNLEDLKQYAAKIYDEMYPESRNITDATDRQNSLNRFVAYHLMNRMQATNEFVSADMQYYYVPGSPVYGYIEMMAPNTLLEVLNGKQINKRKDGSSIQFLTVNRQALNGIYHEIDGILTYDTGMESDVLNKKIRIDFASMMPEMITNKLRVTSRVIILPHGYCSNILLSEDTQLQYIPGGHNYEWDEVLPCGRYDFTVRVPPIPAGTYEVRFGYSPYVQRGVGQMYFDGVPCGIPLDNSLYADNPKIGWIQDNQTDDEGIENDKMMRNRGYMKGPTVLWTNGQTTTARDDSWCLRRIMKIATFEKTETHTFRVKCVEEADKEFHLDYLEFVPTYLLTREGKD